MIDTVEYLRRAHDGDKEARDTLITENMGLIWSIVRRFSGRGYDAEDLFQIGSIGLMKAIDHFDLTMEVRLSTYAVPMIMGEIKRFLRDDGMVKVSRKWKEEGYLVRQSMQQLSQSLGREPCLREISAHCGIPEEEIVLVMEANAEVDSLNRPLSVDGAELTVMDRIPQKERMEDKILNEYALEQVLDTLPVREREIIRMRYFQNRTQAETAKEFAVSQVQVSRLEKRILEKLRAELNR